MRTVLIAAFAALTLTACSTGSAGPEEAALSPSPVASSPAPNLSPDDALAAAIRAGDAKAVEDALAAGANPDLGLGSGVTALAAATQHDDVAMVASLIAAGAELEAPGDDGRTALIIAAGMAGPDVIGALLGAGADTGVFSTDVYNVSALHAAAQHCNPAALEPLIGGGMDVNMVNPDYNATALHASAYWNCPEVAQGLIRSGVSLGVRGSDGKTALTIARERGSDDVMYMLEAVGAPE